MSNLTFQNTTLTVVPHNNQTYITSTDLACALGYSDTRSITNIYNRNQDEFSADMTDVINLMTSGNLQTTVRIFSLRGAHLIAIFSRTKVAKEFRKWVLDILDKEIKQSTLPTPKPEKRYHFELTEFELEQLAWLWFSHRQMNDLLGELINPLKAIESRYSSTVYSHYHEYKRHNRDTLTVIQRFAEPFLQSERLNWQRVVKRLTA